MEAGGSGEKESSVHQVICDLMAYDLLHARIEFKIVMFVDVYPLVDVDVCSSGKCNEL